MLVPAGTLGMVATITCEVVGGDGEVEDWDEVLPPHAVRSCVNITAFRLLSMMTTCIVNGPVYPAGGVYMSV